MALKAFLKKVFSFGSKKVEEHPVDDAGAAEAAAAAEAERLAAEKAAEAERTAAEEKERADAEAAAKAEVERTAAEEAAKAEAARLAEEEAAKAEADRLAAEQAAEAERKDAEEKARAQAEAAKREADRLAAEQAARAEAEERAEAARRAAAEEAARKEAEQQAAEEKARAEAEAAAKAEADRVAAEDAARAEAERLAAEEEAKAEAERVAAEEAVEVERKAAEAKAQAEAAEAARRNEEERARAKAEAERVEAEETAKAEAEQQAAEERARAEAEAAEAEAARLAEEEAAKAEADRLAAEQAAEADRRAAEAKAKAEAEAAAEEAARAEAERIAAEEAARRAAEEKAQAETEAAAVEAARKAAEEEARAEAAATDSPGGKVTVAETVETAPAEETEPAPAPEPEKKSWFKRLSEGLSRSSRELTSSVTGLFTKRKLDEETLQDLEDILIQADLGLETAIRITDALSQDRYGKNIEDAEVRAVMGGEITKVLEPVALPLELDLSHSPHVILVVGVNGTGKTTTIGKLAAKLRAGGLDVMLAAGDTFRAAAIEQLHIWGDRVGAPVVSTKLGADAAGLAYDAFEKARAAGSDVLIIDTAGRLQNKTELMDELAKIVRVLGKLDPEAPHTVLQTLDATTGQNALSQVEIFRNVAGVNGLVMTKLDGTARGGILVAIAAKHKLPVYFVGVGEQVDDLEPFAAKEFASAIVGEPIEEVEA